MDIDFVLMKERPTITTYSSSIEDGRELERWERSNRLCMMIIKHSIPPDFRGVVPSEVEFAKEFLDVLEKSFAKNKDEEMCKLLIELTSMRYTDNENMWEHVAKMFTVAAKLKELRFVLSDNALVPLVLDSLPSEFDQFKGCYYHTRDQWTLNELICRCVQEDERLKKEKLECFGVASSDWEDNFGKRKNETADSGLPQKKQATIQA